MYFNLKKFFFFFFFLSKLHKRQRFLIFFLILFSYFFIRSWTVILTAHHFAGRNWYIYCMFCTFLVFLVSNCVTGLQLCFCANLLVNYYLLFIIIAKLLLICLPWSWAFTTCSKRKGWRDIWILPKPWKCFTTWTVVIPLEGIYQNSEMIFPGKHLLIEWVRVCTEEQEKAFPSGYGVQCSR